MKLLFAALLMIPFLYAGEVRAGNCQELVVELKAMKKAQQEIMGSLANNHETFAVAVEEIAADLELRASKLPVKAAQSMNKTAQAFRQRGVQAKKTVGMLGDATDDLISRVETCLLAGSVN